MSQEEFHRIYLGTPEKFKAELVKGTVFVAPPVSLSHGESQTPLSALFMAYESETLGIRCGDNVTIILNDESEIQPDLYLRILPEYGGQSKISQDDYIVGAPELIAEIAYSSAAIDLHGKREEYKAAGLKEYLVLLPREGKLRWFNLTENKELFAAADGICHISVFPGLWIDAHAILRRDISTALTTLQRGLDSPEHKQFVEQLAARKLPAK
jgi:Uma2 family endonuclease